MDAFIRAKLELHIHISDKERGRNKRLIE